jgi:ABC-type multidrug transport system permease subunit
MMSAPMMGAANFARERERGTWEGVLLSPLSARSITVGKIGSALLAIGAFSLPVVPLLALCVARRGGISFTQVGLTLAIVGATAYSFSAFASLASWKAARTPPVAAGMLLFVMAQSMGPFLAVHPAWHWLIVFNPPAALAIAAGAAPAFGLGANPLLWALGCIAALLLSGALCEGLVRRALRAQGHP